MHCGDCDAPGFVLTMLEAKILVDCISQSRGTLYAQSYNLKSKLIEFIEDASNKKKL